MHAMVGFYFIFFLVLVFGVISLNHFFPTKTKPSLCQTAFHGQILSSNKHSSEVAANLITFGVHH